MRRARAVLVLLASASAAGCDMMQPPPDPIVLDLSGPEQGHLAEAHLWTRAADDDDMFAEPGDVPRDCTARDDWGARLWSSGNYFEVDTEHCNGLTVTQPMMSALYPGDTIVLTVAHTELSGTGQAVLALGVGQDAIWESTIALPAGDGTITAALQVQTAMAEGTAVQFHIDDDGANRWRLLSLMRR